MNKESYLTYSNKDRDLNEPVCIPNDSGTGTKIVVDHSVRFETNLNKIFCESTSTHKHS